MKWPVYGMTSLSLMHKNLVGDVMADLQSYDVKLANKSSMSDTDRLNWFGGR